jgi:hypothetical protein
MDSGIKNKLFNYEVAPPSALWEKISVELDDSELSSRFPSRLRAFAVVPPVQAWHKIVALLDETSLVHDYAARLSAITATPPPYTWNKIAAALDAEVESVPIRRKSIPWFRYAAAAAVLALLVWAGTGLLNKKQTAEPSVASTTNNTNPVMSPQPEETAKAAIDSAAFKKLIAQDEVRNDEALEASKKTFAKLDSRTRSNKIRNAADFFFASDAPQYNATTRGFSFATDESDCLELSCRYIMLMTPEGNIIRMSKKLSDLVCCVSGEDTEKDCVDQMKKWRQKLAYTPSGHSPSNFIELLNLVNALQEQQEP